MNRFARHGLSLIEVMLALSIMAVALMLLGQLLRIGSQNASRARDLTKAQLYCQSVVDSIESGVLQAVSISDAQLPEDPEWTFSVETGQLEFSELLSVKVRVTEISDSTNPVSAEIMRWMIDPAYILEVEAAADAAEAEAEAAASEETTDA